MRSSPVPVAHLLTQVERYVSLAREVYDRLDLMGAGSRESRAVAGSGAV
jgi:hypothetical protein